MSWIKPIALALALGITTPVLTHNAFAEDTAAGKPAKEEKKKEVKGPKLWGAWAKLASLTPEQKIKIKEIHDKTLDEKKKLEEQEEAAILALLSDEQKVELQAIKEAAKEEEAAKKKAKDAEKAAGEKKAE